MSADQFLITGPAVISFSGGRTSAYMLWRILQAHGGTLPDDVVVCFANTGREMPATLDFVRDCSEYWGVPVVWLEFVRRANDGFRVVDHATANRNGEPFSALIKAKRMLPNPVMRFCTEELKIRTIRRYIKAVLGWKKWGQVIGLRADEPNRLKKTRPGAIYPLAKTGVTKPDVLAFWKGQNFDLRLAGAWEGNCDGCFLKSRAAKMRMIRDHQERMRWWPITETAGVTPTMRDPHMALFRSDQESYAELFDKVARTPRLPFDETMHELGGGCDGYCGV